MRHIIYSVMLTNPFQHPLVAGGTFCDGVIQLHNGVANTEVFRLRSQRECGHCLQKGHRFPSCDYLQPQLLEVS